MSKLMLGMAALNEELGQQSKHVEKIKTIIDAQKESYCIEEIVPAAVAAAPEEGGESKAVGEVSEAEKPHPSTVRVDKTVTGVAAVSATIMQHMVYHRVLMSPVDAVFCTQFLYLLHDKETPHFSLLHCYDRMVKTIAPLIFSTTEAEASFIGYALNDMFKTINRWLSDKVAYQTEFNSKLGSTYSIDNLLPAETVEKVRAKVSAAAAAAMDVESEGLVNEDEEGLSHELFVELAKVSLSSLYLQTSSD